MDGLRKKIGKTWMVFCSLDHAFSNYDERSKKFIFKVNHTLIIEYQSCSYMFGAAGEPSSGSPKDSDEIVRMLRHKCRISEGWEWVTSVCCHLKEPSVTECDRVWPSVTECDRVWPSVTECDRVWPSVIECVLRLTTHRCSIRTISSGSFGLPEDGAPAAPKHVGARLIF
jgi:hypothetical protein